MQHASCSTISPFIYTRSLTQECQLPILANLSSLLTLNSGFDKEHIATKKNLLYHTDMKFERDLKVLPLAISWFDKARDFSENDREESNVDARKLSAIYQFARAVPLMFVPASPKNASNKRKIDEVNW
mmetsp:Transcript_31008/g.65484  ORF Transcript_31008/g.65484 Transcript_31008/m.65484 type:complete len:128 (-) Transcript_31008:149-532(-)